jgi:hypothetical protein
MQLRAETLTMVSKNMVETSPIFKACVLSRRQQVLCKNIQRKAKKRPHKHICCCMARQGNFNKADPTPINTRRIARMYR